MRFRIRILGLVLIVCSLAAQHVLADPPSTLIIGRQAPSSSPAEEHAAASSASSQSDSATPAGKVVITQTGSTPANRLAASRPASRATQSSAASRPRQKNTAVKPDPNARFELPAQITMHVGEIRVLNLRDIDTVAVGSGKVISTTVIHKDRDLMILAEEAGESSVYIWDKTGRRFSAQIRVNTRDIGRIRQEVGDALAGLGTQISIKNIGEKVVVEGKNLSSEASALVAEVAKSYPSVTNLTTGRGVIDKTFADMIHFDLQFLEVKRSAASDLGVKWDSATSGGIFFGLLDDIFTNQSNGFRVIPSTTSSTDWTKMPSEKSTKWYLGSSFTLGSVINLLVSKGDAYVLAAPKLTTRRGGKAKFLAGGEIPLTAISSNGATSITFKQYGIMLNINADWTPDEIISGAVQAEVSSIDSSVTVQGNPGFLTRRTENEFSLHDGDTIVLSGLINKEGAKAIDKLPFLGDIPVLGTFFKNTDGSNKDNELIVFITPRLIKPSSALNVEAIRNGVTNINQQSQKVNNIDVVPAEPTQGETK
jgi:pilus assembly protein CpaC